MTSEKRLTAALYARVSTADQTTENQLLELRRCAEARGWSTTEYLSRSWAAVSLIVARVS